MPALRQTLRACEGCGLAPWGPAPQWCGLRPSVLGQDRSETKKSVLVLQVPGVVKHFLVTLVIIILKDTATFEVLLFIFVFILYSSGLRTSLLWRSTAAFTYLKVKSSKYLCLLPVVLVLRIWREMFPAHLRSVSALCSSPPAGHRWWGCGMSRSCPLRRGFLTKFGRYRSHGKSIHRGSGPPKNEFTQKNCSRDYTIAYFDFMLVIPGNRGISGVSRIPFPR